jgi:hypothetical protein
MKNQNLYTHLFNLRQMLHSIMQYDNCRSLQYAVKLNMITHLNAFMDQLHTQEHLNPITLIFEDGIVSKTPSIKEVIDVQNQIFSFTQLIKDLAILEPNFFNVALVFDEMRNHLSRKIENCIS